MIRNGRLWSAHNFTVSNAGVANTAAAIALRDPLVRVSEPHDDADARAVGNGVRQRSPPGPRARQYWIPSVVVTGQGHSVLGTSMAGTTIGATPVYVGRLAGDTLGTMTGPPTVAAVTFGTTTANYNPPSRSGRRLAAAAGATTPSPSSIRSTT